MTDRLPGADRRRAGPPLGDTVVAAGVLALAGVVGWQALSIPVSPIYAKVGPTVVPLIAALGLAVMGFTLLVMAWRGGWQPHDERTSPIDRAALGWVAAGLVLNVVLIGTAGFTIASVILFVCVARAFGSRAVLRNAAIGAALALVAWLGFARTLGIDIGSGPAERGIERLLGGDGR